MLLLVRLVLNALALMAVTYLVPGILVQDFTHAFIAAIILGLVNALIRPFFDLLSLPTTILTLGLFTLVINALMFWLALKIAPGVSAASFSAAFWGGIVFCVASWLISRLIAKTRV